MSELSLSYSSIKDFEQLSPKQWHDKWINKNFPKEIKRVFSFGSLLDCLLFEPEYFDKRFVVSEEGLPSDTICDLVSGIYGQFVTKPTGDLLSYSDLVLESIGERNYWPTRKPVTNLKNILKEGSSYFQLLTESSGKIVVSQADVDKCLRMRENAWNDTQARQFLIPEEMTTLEFQKTIKTKYKFKERDVNIKCIFDVCYTNELTKTKRVIDLKSTANGNTFSGSVDKYRYGAQMGLYCYALFADESVEGYTIEPPINLVIDKKTETVLFHEYTWDDLKRERWGTDQVKGWHYLIREIAMRYENNDWD